MGHRGGITIRHGAYVFTVDSASAAVDLVERLERRAYAPPPLSGGADVSYWGTIAVVAQCLLGNLSKAFHLQGKAAKSLGTALRVARVRHSLGADVKGIELLKNMSYM